MTCPEQQPAWQTLTGLAGAMVHRDSASLLADDARNQALRIELPGMLLDLTRQRVDLEILQALLTLAEQQDLQVQVERLLCGSQVNSTEGRAALHTALRAAPDARPPQLAAEIGETLARVLEFAAAVITGTIRGHGGRPFTDVVHIGIGGSNLGPELVVEALSSAHGEALRGHFVANVDGDALTRALEGLDPATTLFVVVSKSFSTLETRANAESARSWFVERTGRPDAVEQHFVAVSANTGAAAEFGITTVYPMWDWVGGRYSLWSAVGLTIALCLGPDAFRALLAGARAMDRHFSETPPERNGPVLAALIGIWNYDFLGASSLAVLPYDGRLRRLPDYLQQLEMESNGKSVHHDGSAVGVHTMPVLWGGEGTTGQHSFHQLLHQGTRAFTADFLLTASADHALDDHHRWLLANGLAQAQAMMEGEQSDDPHRTVTGNKPTTTIVLERLTAHTLGALLALYEHKVFCQGAIWDINSFDQWGVELGKRLALPIYQQLGGSAAVRQDASTRYLIERLRRPREETGR